MEERRIYHLGDCKNGHKALLLMEDVTERVVKKGSDEKCLQCICLECGEFFALKTKNIKEANNLVITNLDQMEIFQYFERIKQAYLGYITQGLTIEEAVSKVNEKYNEEEKPKQMIKNKNTIVG